jgi:hypothetical protein
MSPLWRLSSDALTALCRGFEAGRVSPPYTEQTLRRYVPQAASIDVIAELDRLDALGMTAPQIHRVLALLCEAPRPAGSPSLVWSGPEAPGSRTRDTGVVVRELFGGAEKSVLVAGFAVHQGKSVFQELAARMDAHPALQVCMFLNVARDRDDVRPAAEIVQAFGVRLKERQWPGSRLPIVYYDPRGAEPNAHRQKRAVLHAKCVVVDDLRAFVTSANFTEAAQERNIEVGVLVDGAAFARDLRVQFERLVASGTVTRVPGI